MAKSLFFAAILLILIPKSDGQQIDVPSILESNELLISNVNYIDVINGLIVEDQDIFIKDGMINTIDDQVLVSENITSIDGSGKWLSPGLIDAHIHMFQSGGLYTRPDAIDLTAVQPYEQEVLWLKENASQILKSYLSIGITTIIDVGGPMHNYKIKKAYDGTSDHPNIYLTGPLISTYQPDAFMIEDPPIIKTNSAEEARRLVQMQLPYQPDFIKIWYIVTPGGSADSTYDIVQATIEESHKYGLDVAVHATQLKTAKLAIQAGADILVHSVSDPVDDEFIKMLLENDVVYIPTLVVHGNYNLAFTDAIPLGDQELKIVSPEVIGSLLDVKHLNHPDLAQSKFYKKRLLSRDNAQDVIRKSNLKKLSNAGVIIATGTDAGNIGTLHASSYYNEIKAMKEAGLTNLEILRASTFGAAHVINQQDSMGSIAVGMKADLLLLRENPLENIMAVKNPKAIIRNGRLVDHSDLINDTPEDLAQRQLNAYNLRNIEAFLGPYSDSVHVYNFPDQLMYVGKEKMRTNYTAFFKRTPELHCALINRIVLGNTVIDQERVTGLEEGREIRAVAIYKIRDDKIAEVYFDRGG